MKSKNKAFTLVELIGVVAILAIMLLVAVPALTKTLKNNEQQKYNTYITDLELATENYVVKNILGNQTIDNENPYFISLNTLIENGYVEDTMVNPATEREISTDTRIKVTRNTDESFQYDVQEYYTSTDDYNFGDLSIHYDAVEYRTDNIFKNCAGKVDLDYDGIATWTENGVVFSGGDKGFPLNSSYDVTSSTVSVNLKPNDETSNYFNIYKDFANGYHFFDVYTTNFYFYSEDSSNWIESATTTDYQLEQKNYTFTFVYDASLQTPFKLYINGNQVELDSDFESAPVVSYDYFAISSEGNWTINNILFYNRALSDNEVSNLYQLDKERFGE